MWVKIIGQNPEYMRNPHFYSIGDKVQVIGATGDSCLIVFGPSLTRRQKVHVSCLNDPFLQMIYSIGEEIDESIFPQNIFELVLSDCVKEGMFSAEKAKYML